MWSSCKTYYHCSPFLSSIPHDHKCHFFNLLSSISFLRHSWGKKRNFLKFYVTHLSLIFAPTSKHQNKSHLYETFIKILRKNYLIEFWYYTSLKSLTVLKYNLCFSTKSRYWSLNWSRFIFSSCFRFSS